MSISKNKWFLIFLYLVTAFVVATSLGFILILFVIEFCISIYTKRTFDFSNIDFMQCVKIGIGGGGIGGVGCWVIYYKNYK
ncbi:hypothetical protein [Rosenbergiella collisarenosi]|uniref:hypothetical protein n=1 Tax=Rosenbergiella collisarenosi TaxID=1544695 RepID=UPI001F4FE32A|nr:hypothetical protein [Rosenbergiella collisarenosi]